MASRSAPAAPLPPAPPLPPPPVWQLRARVRHWWQSRLRPTDSVLLTQRNVYILPTAPGWMLALTLLVLLVASINYQLNLGYLLTFLLAGSALAAMHVSHGNLRGVRLHLVPPEPCFAATAAPLEIALHQDGRALRPGIALSVLDGGAEAHWSTTDVPPQGSATVHVAHRPARRGLHPLPLLTAETRFPLGTFRVWTVWRPAAQLLVYPAPETNPPPLPPAEPRAGDTPVRSTARAPGDFDGVRGYQRGDPLKLVVWKKAAAAIATGSDALTVRDTSQAQRHALWLDAAGCGLRDPEACLSRLAAWVLQADRLGVEYGLRLPGRQIAPATGAAHQRQCLEALALC